MNNVETTVTTEDKAFVAGLAKKARGKKASRKAGTKATKSKEAKTPQPKSTKASEPAEGREGSKKAIILELLHRKEGATIADIATATDWQNHSIRGFLSAHVGKKMGLKIESEKNEAGKRAYRIG